MALPPTHRPIHLRLLDNVLTFLEAVFFNATLKLVSLRLLLLSILVSLGIEFVFLAKYDDDYDRSHIVGIIKPIAFILVHHTVSAFIIRFIPRWLDFILIGAQVVVLWKEDISPLTNLIWWPNSFDSTPGALVTICLWTMAVNVGFMFLCRTAAIIRHKGVNLAKTFDLLEDRTQDRTKSLPVNSFLQGFSLLVGRSLWSTRFIGEALHVRVLRGFVAGCLAVAIIVYGLLTIVVQPALESSFIPTKQSRADIFNYPWWGIGTVDTWEDLFKTGGWNFYFALAPNDPRSMTTLVDAINVAILSDHSTLEDFCKNEIIMVDPDSNYDRPVAMLKANCENQGNWINIVAVITIDFTLLNSAFGIGAGVVAVYPSLTNDTDVSQMLRDTVPFPLPAGSNYFGTVSVKGRKAFDGRSRKISSLGMFDSPKAYLVPSIQYAVLDPHPPPAARLSPNISSLRLSTAFDTAEFHVEADQRDQTVFAGFSTVGGLFTFISGMFAVIFGTTFLRILFDIRELSIFGIAQKWDRKKIVKAYLDAYPSLRAELEMEASQHGVVAVLQDHLLDMKLFQQVLDAERQESESMEMETRVKDEEEAACKDSGHSIQRSEDTVFGEEEVKLLSGGPSKSVDGDISMERPV